jgi:hypothetical protein
MRAVSHVDSLKVGVRLASEHMFHHRLTATCPSATNAGKMTLSSHAHAQHVGCIQSGLDLVPCEMPRWLRERACPSGKRADARLDQIRRLHFGFKRRGSIHQGLHEPDCCPLCDGERHRVRTVYFKKSHIGFYFSAEYLMSKIKPADTGSQGDEHPR